jgi:MOSC domain-containing protein YiiM
MTDLSGESRDRGRIVGLQVSLGGVPKLPIEQGFVTSLGLMGDHQRDKRYHGGPPRALCIFSMDCIEELNAEGHPISPGSAGENVTVRGLDWDSVVPGQRYRLGDEVEIEITEYTIPCANIAGSFAGGEFVRILQKKHPGYSRVYARILKEGTVKVGDEIVGL